MLQLVLVCKTNKDIASTGYLDNFSEHDVGLKGSGANRAELLCWVPLRLQSEDEVGAQQEGLHLKPSYFCSPSR